MDGLAVQAPRLQGLPVGRIMNVQSGSGRVAVPVHNFSMFTRFRHVEGVPAGSGPGYSVAKLQVLDILIDRLVKLREHDAVRRVPEDRSGLKPQAVDALINELADRLRIAATAPVNPADVPMGPEFGMAVSQTGAVVSQLA